MKNEIVLFDLEGRAARTISRSGEPRWALADVCVVWRFAIHRIRRSGRMTFHITRCIHGRKTDKPRLPLLFSPRIAGSLFRHLMKSGLMPG